MERFILILPSFFLSFLYHHTCRCVPMRERHECHCMLFITEDNDFVGEDTNITFEEVVEKAGGMSM